MTNVSNLLAFSIGLLAIGACTHGADPDAQRRQCLTDGGTKYWDLIYSTDIYGHFQESHYYVQRSVGDRRYHAEDCVRFEASGRAMHYRYLDSVRVLDSGCNTDIVPNPDRFVFPTDSLVRFGGRNWVIATLTNDFMVLRWGPTYRQRCTRIYARSPQQALQVVPCRQD